MGMIQESSAIPEPQHWPLINMSVFGKVPGRTENLYRLVFAPSVKTLMGGEDAEGHVGYHVRPRYRHVGNQWILEKWLSAFELTGMDEAHYNARYKDPSNGLILTGPYPSQGAYFMVHRPLGPRPNINIELLVALINKAKYNSRAQNRQAIIEAQERAEKQEFQQRFDRIKDLSSVGGIRPANIAGNVKKLKSLPPIQDARKLGLPTRGPGLMKPTGEQLSVAGF